MAVFLSYLFYFVASSIAPLQRRWLAVKRDADSLSQIQFALDVTLVSVVLSFALPFFSPFKISGNIYELILLGLACGLFSALFMVGSYTAQKHVEAGVSSIVSNIYTPITIVLATIFLNEKLTSIQVLGTIFLLIAIVLISKKHRIGRFTFDKYFLLMLGSGVVLGVALVLQRALIKITGFTAGSMISWAGQAIFLWIAVLVTRSKRTYSQRDIWVTGTLRFFQILSWVILIYFVGNLSVVSSVTTFKVVIIFIFAALFLGEREDIKRKIAGSLLAVIGLLLMR